VPNEREDAANGGERVTETLTRLLESHYGARQLGLDLDRYPHTLTAEQRASLEDAIDALGRMLDPIVPEICRIVLSPKAVARLVHAQGEAPDTAARWDRFQGQVGTVRDVLARAARALRVKRSTGEFRVIDDVAGSPAPDTRDAALERDKVENGRLLAVEFLAAVPRPRSRPTRILVDVTNKCNFRCRTCYQSASQDFVPNDLHALPLGNLRSFMRTATTMCVAGTGEPLLSPLTPTILKLAASYRMETELVTNGSLFHRLAGLEDSITRLFLSLDGASSETVDVIRKGAKFSNIVAAVRELPEALRARVFLSMVVCRANLHEIHGIARLARELGVAAVHLQEFSAYLPWHASLQLRPEDRPLLRRELAMAKQELSPTTISMHAQFGMDPEAKGNGFHEAHAPAYEEILGELDRTPPPHAKHPEPWDVAVRRFADAAQLEIPEEIFANRPDAARNEGRSDVSGDADPVSRTKRLLAVLQSKPVLRLPHCVAPYSLLYVLGDGAIRPCCLIEHRSGDLGSTDVESHWHSPAQVALRRALRTRDDLPSHCIGCRDGSRFAMLPQILDVASLMGIDLEKIQLPDDGAVPQEIVELIDEAKAQAACDPVRLVGYLDGVDRRTLYGWAYHPDRPNGIENVDLWLDGEFFIRSRALNFRSDLEPAGIGDGRHSFLAELPPDSFDGREHEIVARFARSGLDLVGSPLRIRLARSNPPC
jgi:MoaA/NifB/PqqE/SkfB family radical SAM enzyme